MPSPYASASTDNDARLAFERAQELPQETGLADTRRPDDRCESARRLSHNRFEGLAELAELFATTDERRADGARKGRHVGMNAQQPPRGERLTLALRHDTAGRLDNDGVPDKAIGPLADEHLALLCSLLEPRRHIDGIARRKLLIRGAVTNDHLARVDAGTRQDTNAVLARKIDVHAIESLTHVERRSHRPKGIVFVYRRHAEHRHDRVADELLDRAAVSLDRCLHRIEVTPHHAPERLGIESFTERGRPDDVREDDGDHLPRHSLARLGVEPLPAGAAEPCVGVVLTSTGTADHGA